MSARDFNQDVSAAKRSAAAEPLIITDRGRPSHVLLSFEDYQHLKSDQRNIADLLTADDDIDFEPPRLELLLAEPEQ